MRELTLKRYDELSSALYSNVSISALQYKDCLFPDGSDVLLWAILKELIVPKIRKQDRKMKDLESRLKIVEDHLNREASAEFSLAMQEEYLKHSTKKRTKKA